MKTEKDLPQQLLTRAPSGRGHLEQLTLACWAIVKLCFVAALFIAFPATAFVSATNDAQFITEAGVNGIYVHALLIEPDDKIVIAGNFSTVCGEKRTHIARLLPNGGLDAGFNPGTGPNSEVLCVARQLDGKILIGGNFGLVNGIPRPRLARLNRDGSVDQSFNAGVGPNNEVRAIVVQPNGKILAGGFFTSVNRTNSRALVRLNADGSYDPTFKVGAGPSGGNIFALALQSDGRILAGGEYISFDGKPRGSITRLEQDGSQDPAFYPKGVDSWIGCIRVQADGKILVAGDFNTCCGVSRLRITRLNPDGSLDTGFNPGKGVNSSGFALVHSMVLDNEGGILLGGLFTQVNGTNRNYLARLYSNGSLDLAFNPVVNGPVRFLALNSLGRLVIGGEFSRVSGVTANRIGRLGTSFDSSYLRHGFSSVCKDLSGFYTTFHNASGLPMIVQSSSDLVNWEDQVSVEVSGSVRLADPAEGQLQSRFFRGVVAH